MRRRSLLSARLAGLLVLVIGAGVVGVYLVDGRSSASSPQILLRDARGAIAIDQTRAGRAIVRSDDLRPGMEVRGHTTVENTGDARARIKLTGHDLESSMGPDDMPFADVLQLRVRKRTLRNPDKGPKTKYEGTLGAMPAVKIGVWRPGAHHQFTFRVYYPNGEWVAGGPNAWQGSHASIGFTWTATPPH
jgi:hypothetical protein